MAAQAPRGTIARYGRLFAVIALVVAVSASGIVVAAGGSTTEAVIVGGVGLVLGGTVGAYLGYLLRQLNRRP